MKTKSLLTLVLCLFFIWVKAQNFNGRIQYKVKTESPDFSKAVLMFSPKSATLHISSTGQAIFSFGITKIMANAANMERHIFYEYRMLFGKNYCMVNSEYELKQKEDTCIKDLLMKETGKTKIIYGHTAYQIIATYVENGLSKEADIWCVDDFTDSFCKYASFVSMLPLKGFPLEYRIREGNTTTTFTISKIKYTTVNEKVFRIPNSYSIMTEEQMKFDLMLTSLDGQNLMRL